MNFSDMQAGRIDDAQYSAMAEAFYRGQAQGWADASLVMKEVNNLLDTICKGKLGDIQEDATELLIALKRFEELRDRIK